MGLRSAKLTSSSVARAMVDVLFLPLPPGLVSSRDKLPVESVKQELGLGL